MRGIYTVTVALAAFSAGFGLALCIATVHEGRSLSWVQVVAFVVPATLTVLGILARGDP